MVDPDPAGIVEGAVGDAGVVREELPIVHHRLQEAGGIADGVLLVHLEDAARPQVPLQHLPVGQRLRGVFDARPGDLLRRRRLGQVEGAAQPLRFQRVVNREQPARAVLRLSREKHVAIDFAGGRQVDPGLDFRVMVHPVGLRLRRVNRDPFVDHPGFPVGVVPGLLRRDEVPEELDDPAARVALLQIPEVLDRRVRDQQEAERPVLPVEAEAEVARVQAAPEGLRKEALVAVGAQVPHRVARQLAEVAERLRDDLDAFRPGEVREADGVVPVLLPVPESGVVVIEYDVVIVHFPEAPNSPIFPMMYARSSSVRDWWIGRFSVWSAA